MNPKWLVCLSVGLAFTTVMANAQTTQTPPLPNPPSVQAATSGAQIKIDGRMFVGVFASQSDGAYPLRTMDIPDAKLRFTFTPNKDITIVNRFSNNKAASNGFDYFYMDLNNWGGMLPGHTLRLGKMKIDFGEETWTDNPVESILISNSAAAVGGYDEGLNFRGPLVKGTHPATYSLSLLNGSKGVDTSAKGLLYVAKAGFSPIKNIYFSASYLDSDMLEKANGAVASTDIKFANLTDPPTGATNWERKLWELDARWNYGPNGVASVVGSLPTSLFQLAGAYGRFEDIANNASSRGAHYWYAEGLLNITHRLYVASRYSTVHLDGSETAKLADSPVAVNCYNRLSAGFGYRLTALTQLKTEYSFNHTDGGTTAPKLNQFTIGVATKF